MARLPAALALLLAALIVGCGAENPLGRKALSGKVTLDGAPLPQGNIELHPLAAGGTQSGGTIMGGQYSIPAHQGATPGKYRVSIIDFVPSPPPPPGFMPGDDLPPAPPPKVPPQWNSQSEHTIEVKPEGPFTFDFAIETKKK